MEPLNRNKGSGIWLPSALFLGALMIGADFWDIEGRPLQELGIQYSRFWDWAYVLIPALCVVLWIFLRRKRPVLGPVMAVLLCFAMVPLPAAYAHNRVARVPVVQWLTQEQMAELPFRIFQRGSSQGNEILVNPQNEAALREYLARSREGVEH